jgi:hypothetical protein
MSVRSVAFSLLCSLAGCTTTWLAPNQAPAPLGREVVLRPEAVLLDTLAGVEAIDVAPDRVVVTGDPGALLLTEGDVIVGRRGGGYLRRVDAVETTPDGLVLFTEPASLGDVILEASALQHITLDTRRSAYRWDLGGAVLLDERIGDPSAGAHVSVVIAPGAYAQIEPTFDLTLDWFDDTTNVGFDTAVRMDAVADFVATADGAVDLSHEQALGEQTVPFEFWIGPVPVVGEATITLAGRVALAADGTLQQTLHTEAHASVSLAAGYADDWWSDADADASFVCDPSAPTATGMFRARATLVAHVSTTLYGTATPYAEVAPWVEASSCDPDLTQGVQVRVDSGIDGVYGGSADVFGWELASFGPEPFTFGPWNLSNACD